MQEPEEKSTEITVEKSMLEQAARMHDEMRKLRPEDAGKDHLTFLQRPYARAEPEDAVRKASVWFTAYMPSVIGPLSGPQHDGEMVKPLATLCDPGLWTAFADLGIHAVHTGPVMKAGGFYADGERYASIDGWFDPIALDIDTDLGKEEDYTRLTWMAEHSTNDRGERLNAVVIGDIVPGHTGMGADFHLALQGVDHYPGLYVLARVDQVLSRNDPRHYGLTEDEVAGLLADFPEGQEDELSRLLTEAEVRALVRVSVIPGKPQRAMGAQAGFGWSITREMEGSPDDSGNTSRRWVYLHFFHPKQPTLNFLDSGYAAWRMVTGQLNYVLWDLRSTGVRLDANAFLGIEPIRKMGATATDLSERQTWSEAHPLSATVTNMLAWQTRRLGGFSFEEKNLTVGDIAKSGEFGPDLAYDFITRPACEHALLTGKIELLDFMFAEMKRFHVRPGQLVHALQNHDELTYELVHLAALESAVMHGGGEGEVVFRESSAMLRADMRRYALGRDGETDAELLQRAPNSFFNKESPNGLCTTLAGLVAAKLGARTLEEAARQADGILKGHLLLAAFNALQPGVFALSGWDLVGALPVAEYDLPQVLTNAGEAPRDWKDKDYRWVNRGAYRLMSTFGEPGAGGERYGVFCLPEAQTLYGTLDVQQKNQNSFFNQLRRMLQVREQLELPVANFAGTLVQPGTSLFGFRLWAPFKGDRRAVVVLFNFADPTHEATICNLRELVEQQWPTLHWDENEVHVHQHCVDGTNGWTGMKQEEPLTLEPWEWKMVRFTPIAKEL